MIATIRLWVVLAAIGISCAGAAAVYGPRIARNVVPELYIARAVLPIIHEATPQSEVFDAVTLIGQLVSGSWQQEIALGINKIESDYLQLDPSLSAALPVLTLQADATWDSIRQAYAADISLRMALTSVFEASLHLDRNIIAAYVPMLFDFPLTIDPRQISNEWNSSLIGGALHALDIDDNLFYRAYEAALFFERRPAPDFTRFIASIPALASGAEFAYVGREEYDIFSVTLSATAVNNSLSLLWEALESFEIGSKPIFEDDVLIILQIDDSRLVQTDIPLPNNEILSIYFTEGGGHSRLIFPQLELDWHYNNNGRFTHSLSSQYFDISLDWDFSNTANDNLFIKFENNDLSANINGRLRVSDKSAEANLRQINIITEELDAAFNIGIIIEASNEAVVFDAQNARRFADLNFFDLAAMYLRIEDSPLGGILGNLLP